MPKITGRGSIVALENDRKRCRRWQLRVCVGKDKKKGHYRRMTRVFRGSYSEAKAAMREFIGEIEGGTATRSAKQLFRDYSAGWLEREKKRVAHGTWRKRVDHVKCLDMHIGYAWMTEITYEDLEDAYDALSRGESPSGRPLSGTYLSGIASTAHKLFKDAQRDAQREGIAMGNPAELVDAKPKPDTKERKALSHERILELLDKLDPTQPTQLVVRLAVKLGLRRGEVHGLSWSDVDFDAMIVRVHHTYDESGELRSVTKNGKVRTIPLTQSAADDLWAALDNQIRLFANTRKKLKVSAPTVSSATPVVCNGLGERLLPHSSTQWWTRHRDDLGFSGWTIHEMRHTYRTQLRKRKVPTEIAQRLLGHSSEAMSELYDHVDLEEMADAVSVVDW